MRDESTGTTKGAGTRYEICVCVHACARAKAWKEVGHPYYIELQWHNTMRVVTDVVLLIYIAHYGNSLFVNSVRHFCCLLLYAPCQFIPVYHI
jgi:hypothetical protein